MDEIALQRLPEGVHAAFKADVVVAPGAVHKAVDAVEHGHDLSDGVRAGPFVGQFHPDKVGAGLQGPQFGPERVVKRAPAENDGNGPFPCQRQRDAAADARAAARDDVDLIPDPQIHSVPP